MAQNDARLQVVLEAKIDKLTDKLSQANSAFHRTAASIDKRQRDLDKNLSKLGSTLGVGLNRASTVAGVAFAAIVGYSVKAAASAVELQNAFDVAFGAGADGAREYARVLSKEVGRSQLEVQESMVRFRLLLKDQSADLADTITKELEARAIDVGSLFNLKDADVIQKFFSGLSGESEPLKALGVNLNEAALKAELLRLGFKGTVQQASEQAKQIARANIILRQTEIAAGDASKTLDSTSNQFKKLQGETRDAAAAFGEQFLPIANRVLDWASNALKAFNDLPTGTQNAALGLLALVAAGGPIASVVKGLNVVIKAAIAARVALAAVAAAGAGGAAGAAAGGIAGRGLAATAGVAAGTVGLAYVAGSIPSARQDDAERLRRLRDEERFIPTRRGFFDRDKALAKVRAQIAELEANLAAQAVKPGDVAAPADFADFKLTPDLLKPVAGSTGGGGKDAAKKAAADAKRAADLALSQQERTDALIGRANEDLVAARNDLVVGAQARYQAEIDAIEATRQARAKELDYAVLQDDLTASQRELVDAAEDAVRRQDETNARRRRDAELAREQLDLRLADIDAQSAVVAVASQLATTAKARRDAELRLLDLADQRERTEIEAIIASKESTEAERQIARNRLAGLDETAGARRQGVIRDTAGPMEDYFARLPQTAEEVNESMQRLAVDGLESLSTGLADAIVNAESLGDVAKNVFRQMVADLIAQSLRKNFASAGAALLKYIPGFANGTNSAPGGLAWTGERGPELVNLPRGAQVIPNDVLRSLANLKIQAPSTASHATLKMEVNIVGAIGQEGIAAIARREAQRGGAIVLEAAKRGYPAVQERQRRLGTTG